MNNHGQVALIGLMVALFIFLLGMSLINPLRDVIDETRTADQMDCNNASISDGQKLACLAIDVTLPYFIVVVLALAGAWMTTKII